MSPRLPLNHSAPRGLSLLELTLTLAFMAGAFTAILSILGFLGNGLNSDTAYAEQSTRTTGTLYDIVSEVRDASAYSPNFFIEVDPAKPPKFVFDKVDSVDAQGNVIWGSKVTYRLELATDTTSLQFQADHPGIIAGRVVREEVSPKLGQTPLVSVVEERVPYKFFVNDVAAWGFNVTRNGCALAVAISRFGDTRVNTSVSPGPAFTNAAGQVTSVLQGSVLISTATGTYFLKNPKIVIPAE